MIEQGTLVFSDSMEALIIISHLKACCWNLRVYPMLKSSATSKSVNRIEKLTPKSFRLFYDGNKSVSETIITRSVEQNWRLTQLAIEKNSVDEIFKQLTKNIATN